jgi:hypothetical protein
VNEPVRSKPDRESICLPIAGLISSVACLALVTYDLRRLFHGPNVVTTGYDGAAWLIQILAVIVPLLALCGLATSLVYARGRNTRTPGYALALTSLVLSGLMGLPALILALFGMADPHW